MDELSRRLRAASPYGDELPPQGERLLGELRARAAAPSDAHASTEVQRFAPPRAARLVLSFSGAVAALALVMLLVFVIDRPRIANAATPKPLQLVTSAETLQSPLQAVRAAALEDETTDAPPSALGTEYVGWYLQLDEDEPAPDFVQPQRVLNEPLRGGGVRTRAVAEPPRSSAGTLLSPLPNEAEAPGSVLFELRWRPGEFAAGFPKPPPNASAEMREYLEAYLIAHGHTASAGFAADDYAHAIEAMLRSWTLNDAAHRSAIEVLLDSPGARVEGSAEDRAGRAGIVRELEPGLHTATGFARRIVVDPLGWRILSTETPTTDGIPQHGIAAGAVTTYTLWR